MDAALHACPRLALLPVLLNSPHGGAGGAGGAPAASHGAARAQWPAAFEGAVSRGFNKSQQASIWACAGAARGVQLLQGPPGTGKTHSVLGILSALLVRTGLGGGRGAKIAMPLRGATQLPSLTPPAPTTLRVLLCAPSNCAVDELVARILERGLLSAGGGVMRPRLVRLGPQEAMSDLSKTVSLDSLVEQRLDGGRAADFEAGGLGGSGDGRGGGKANGKGGGKGGGGGGAQKRLLRERLLAEAQVVACTLSGSGMDALQSAMGGRGVQFDVVVVDEATQSSEVELLIALQHGCTLACLVGDHRQLPPTIKAKAAERGGMATSLFERLLDAGAPCALLDTQYRMHPAIAHMPNQLFYAGRLRDGVGSERRPSPPPPAGWSTWPAAWSSRPVALLSMPHAREEKEGKSYRNRAEAEAVVRLVVDLLRAVVAVSARSGSGGKGAGAPHEIGVITPYKAQVRLLQSLLAAASSSIKRKGGSVCAEDAVVPAALRLALREVEVSTVDGFQGREKNLVVVSCVRANEMRRGGLGFLTDARRVNVMLTRARSGLVVVGHPQTLMRDADVWGPWVQWARGGGLEALLPPL